MAKESLVTMIALVMIMSGGKKILPDSENNTFECSEDEAKKLESIHAAKRAETTDTVVKDPLLSLKKEELIALAVERKVTIPDDATTKEKIIAFLNSPEGQGEA